MILFWYFVNCDCDLSNKNEFGIRFAAQNSEMSALKERITNEAEKNKSLKIEELKRERIRYYDFLKKASLMNCEYWYDKINKIKHHFYLCQKCSLVSKAEKMVVKIFEWPLPDNENLKNQVVFELIIPPKISYLLDGLHLLRTKVFGFSNATNQMLGKITRL